MMKIKNIISVLIAGALILNSIVAFAVDYISVDSYKTNLVSETFSESELSENWQTANSTLDTYEEEPVLSVAMTASNNYIRRKHDLTTIGIVTYQFDMIVPDSSKITKSMTIGLRQNKDTYDNIPLFYMTSAGAIRSGIDGNWNNKVTVDLTKWTTFLLEYDTQARTFALSVGEKGSELKKVTGLAYDYYATKSTKLDNGVVGLYIGTENGLVAVEDAYYIDNLEINRYPRAYTLINELDSAETVEKILADYESAGLIDIPEEYSKLDKNNVSSLLIDTSLTCDDDIIDIIEMAIRENDILKAIEAYKTNFAEETYSEGELSSTWQGIKPKLTSYEGEDVISIDMTASNNFIRRKNNSYSDPSVKSGIITYRFDMIVPDSSKITKSMSIGLRQNQDTYANIPLFYITGAGGIRSGLDGIWSDKVKVDLTKWTTFQIEYNAQESRFKLFVGPKGGKLVEVTGLANDYYASHSTKLDNGVTSLYIGTDNGALATENAYYLDNLTINHYPSVYELINKLDTTDRVEEIVLAYDEAGILNIPQLYSILPDKTAVNQLLIDTELTYDSQITEIITDKIEKYEKPEYVDLTDVYNADFIAKKGETVDNVETFGIGSDSGIWRDDPYDRDNYLGQVYNGEAIYNAMTSEGILTAQNNCDESRSFKISSDNLSTGVNDAVVIESSFEKDPADESNVWCQPGRSADIKLNGKLLSAIHVAAIGGVPNVAYLGAKIKYTDGSIDDYFDSTYNVPSSGQMKNSASYYQTIDFGKMIYPSAEEGILVDDDRPLTEIDGSVDNRTRSYINVVEIPVDESKTVEAVELYTRSKWGASSIAVFGVTEIPAETTTLIENVNAADGVTIENAKANAFNVIKAYNAVNELIVRGFYSETDAKAVELAELYNVLEEGQTVSTITVEAFLNDSEGNNVSTVKEASTVDITLTCENDTLTASTGRLIYAFYMVDGTLLEVKPFDEYNTAGYATGIFSEKNITVPEDASLLKIFVWDSLTGMKPICDAVVK